MEPSKDQQPPDRFEHLEVGQDRNRMDPASPRERCAHCGHANEPGRRRCRGCFRRLPAPEASSSSNQQKFDTISQADPPRPTQWERFRMRPWTGNYGPDAGYPQAIAYRVLSIISGLVWLVIQILFFWRR